MTNYIWDSNDYPWDVDPGLDILKLEYDKLKEDEHTSALIGTTPPSYQQTSTELVNLMKTRAKKTAMPIHASNVQNSLKSKNSTVNLSQNNIKNLGQNVNSPSTLQEQYPKEASDAAARMAETASGYEKPFPETKITTGIRMPVSKIGASDNLRGHLKKWEGYSHTVQDDGSGNPTGGYGNVTPGSKIGDPIGRNKAEQLLNQDIATAEQDVRRLIGNLPLAQHEFDALVDLAFNVLQTS